MEGTALVDLVDVARKSGALHVRDGYTVRPGDVVILGKGLGQHVATVVAVDGDSVRTVDGGMVADDRLQRIGHVDRSGEELAAKAIAIDVDRLPWK
jgi:hydrogenase maturation factor